MAVDNIEDLKCFLFELGLVLVLFKDVMLRVYLFLTPIFKLESKILFFELYSSNLQHTSLGHAIVFCLTYLL